MTPQSGENPNWDSFGTPPWESRDKKAIWMWPPWKAAEYTIWGKVVASPNPGRGESCESRIACGLS
jgi:hypothetical protein